MVTGTRIDLTPLSSVVEGIGPVYWLLVIVSVAWVMLKSKPWRAKLQDAAIVLLILVGPMAIYVGHGVLRHREAQERLDKAMALFKQRCTSAGERIHRTVESVDGLVWMKWRPASSNQWDQYRLDDPYGSDCGADSCILNLLRVTRGAELNPQEASRHPGRYDFVESTDPKDGKMYRYRAEMLLPWKQEEVDAHRKLTGRDPESYSYRVKLMREPIDRLTAKYGLTWADISTREDRDHWIAGGSLQVVDLHTSEVIAERIGYMIDAGQGNTSGGRQPWTHAEYYACPKFELSEARNPVKSSRSRQFVLLALKPTREK